MSSFRSDNSFGTVVRTHIFIISNIPIIVTHNHRHCMTIGTQNRYWIMTMTMTMNNEILQSHALALLHISNDNVHRNAHFPKILKIDVGILDIKVNLHKNNNFWYNDNNRACHSFLHRMKHMIVTDHPLWVWLWHDIHNIRYSWIVTSKPIIMRVDW